MLRIQKKRPQKPAQEDINEIERRKMDFLIFLEMRMRGRRLFPPVVTTYRMKNKKSSTRGLSLEASALARARAQLLNMLNISTHMSVPNGENS